MYPKKLTARSSLSNFSLGSKDRATIPPKIALTAAKLSKTNPPKTINEENTSKIKRGRRNSKFGLSLRILLILAPDFTKIKVSNDIAPRSSKTIRGFGKPWI